MIGILCALAFAGPEALPRQASVDLPEQGIVTVPVPAALRAPDDPGDGTDLLLLDADGRAVPFAVLRDPPAPELVPARRGTAATRGPLVRWPDLEDGTTVLSVQERPLDALEVRLPHDTWWVQVTLEEQVDGAWQPLGRHRVWRLGRTEQAQVPLPPRLGTYRVTLEAHDRTPVRDIGLVGVRHEVPPLPETTWTLPVTGQVQENGWVRYDLPFPWPQPVDAVAPVVADDLFERQAAVVAVPPQAASPDTLPFELTAYGGERIQRIRLGGADLDDRRVPVPRGTEDPLALLVAAEGEAPLAIDAVEVHLRPQVLVVRDPGPGPHTLLGGAVDPDGSPARLAFAAPELRRAATSRVVPGPVEAHPGFVPEAVRYALETLGRALDPTGLAWRRSLEGQGPTRVALDRHVLTEARADLGDLRLVDGDGRQVPYLLRRRPTDDAARDLPVRRREDGARTVLTVELPEAGLHVQQLVLRTDARRFDRRVTVARPRPGRPPQVLRSLDWDSTHRPAALGIDLHQRTGDRLEVWIDNGDDPALPLDGVDVTWAGWELITWLPEGGAELRYGDPERAAPDYDFAQIDALARLQAPPTALGAPQAAAPPPPAMTERLAVWGGMAFLAVGLLVMLVQLVRHEPGPDDGATSDPAST